MMRIQQGAAAGVAGGIVSSAIMALARALGVPVHIEAMWGTLFFPERTLPVVFFGMVVHLVVCGVIGALYMLAFDHVFHAGGVVRGLALALPHALVVGLLMMAVGPVHALVPHEIPDPGPFMWAYGVGGVVAFVLAHLAFGAIQGASWAARDDVLDEEAWFDELPA